MFSLYKFYFFGKNTKAVNFDIAVVTYITFVNKMTEYWNKWEFLLDL